MNAIIDFANTIFQPIIDTWRRSVNDNHPVTVIALLL